MQSFSPGSSAARVSIASPRYSKCVAWGGSSWDCSEDYRFLPGPQPSGDNSWRGCASWKLLAFKARFLAIGLFGACNRPEMAESLGGKCCSTKSMCLVSFRAQLSDGGLSRAHREVAFFRSKSAAPQPADQRILCV